MREIRQQRRSGEVQGLDTAGKQAARQRREHGVYATPAELTGYLVRSVDLLLRAKLGRARGLADPGVLLLDPAAGPANFLAAAWRLASERHRQAGGDPAALLKDHLLPHFVGCELLASQHAEGLAALEGLAAALDPGRQMASPALLPADALGPPAALRDRPFNVVLGNPPWRGRSANRGAWSEELLRGYARPDGTWDEGCFRVDGQPLGERNPKWLHDDYVKFLRLAQWRIDTTGEGIVAFVVNHNCLEAPTFRGLRRSLLGSFEEVYALDLHGNRRRRERAPDGREDENVFAGVAQGVALLLLVKRPGLPRRVLRADLYGTRRAKLRALAAGDVGSTFWQQAAPPPPAYLLLKGDRRLEREYRQGVALPEIFPVGSAGIVTGRDAWALALDRPSLERRLAELRRRPLAAFREGSAGSKSPAPLGRGLTAREVAALKRDRVWRGKLTGLLFRPFDRRHVFAAPYFLARPRRAVMDHLGGAGNVALVAPRQSKEEPGALVTRWAAGHKAVSACDVSFVFPLFLRPDQERTPNLAPAFVRRLAGRCGAVPDPGAVLAYVYAVLYSPAYRRRYRELLRRDFGRIPLPRDLAHFETLADLGGELVALHLLTAPGLRGAGVRLDRQDGLAGARIASEVWEYTIGAYPVLPRWLRARAGRALTRGEARELGRIAEALRRTLAIEARLAEVPLG